MFSFPLAIHMSLQAWAEGISTRQSIMVPYIFPPRKNNWMRQPQSSSIAPDLLTRVWQRRAIDGTSFPLAG